MRVLLLLLPSLVAAQNYDVVLRGGRVMDPETGLDAVRNVGIRDGRIVRISVAPLAGRRVVRAAGLVVAPASSTCTSMARKWRASASKRLTVLPQRSNWK